MSAPLTAAINNVRSNRYADYSALVLAGSNLLSSFDQRTATASVYV